MFPIAEDKLSIARIASYWSREIEPSASPYELRIEIERAWWRGQFRSMQKPSRLEMLRALYRSCQSHIAFAIGDDVGPPQTRETDDGGLEIIRPVWVPLPNSDLESWNEQGCAAAFEAVADGWDFMRREVLELVGPMVAGSAIDRSEFMEWLTERKYRLPNFWGRGKRRRRSEVTPGAVRSRDSGLRVVRMGDVPDVVRRLVEGLRAEGEYPSEARIKVRAAADGVRVPREWLRPAIKKQVGTARGRPRGKSPK